MGDMKSLPGVLLFFLLNAVAGIMHGQLCNGSLGDPVVNITFGELSNPGSSVYAPPNTYVYSTSPCPDDGSYTITRSSSGCFGNSWHNIASDHTGNGAFMLVNASFDPGDFFLATVNDLCPNTTYEFAAWLMNVMIPDGIKPDVTFSIEKPDGTILEQYSTGAILQNSFPVWKQYGLYFTTPADNPSIVLRITNNAPGGVGNDIALDDITFRPCGPPVDITVHGSTGTIDICEGDAGEIIFNTTVSSDWLSPVFQWQSSIDDGITWTDIPGATQLAFQVMPGSAGNYRYRLTVAEAAANGLKVCRVSSNDILLVIHPKPEVDAGPDRVLIAGQSLTISGNVQGETPVFTWSPPDHLSDPSVLDPVATPAADISYQLRAVSAFGCSNDDNVTIKVVSGIFIPTAFTPNNDNRNDTWRIPFLDPLWDPEIMVYNRYGQLVYHSKDLGSGWDGKLNGALQPAGVYIYFVRLRSLGLVYKGTIALIR